MKKVYVVSKTHLDLGFTDYAKNVLDKYLSQYIPNAIKTANQVNADGKKRFVWTTGSWLLKKALEVDEDGLVYNALKDGNIAPHAMPFTLHTEVLDKDSLDYALSIVDQLDEITGIKTTAAKMTDVPGHTISLVPILAKHGIKLLHIGVNGASAMPKVPECFLWRHKSGAEVVVIYSGSYGGEFKCDLIDEILYFDHTVDNRGARNTEDTIKSFEKVEALYPDYEVEAGRMDDYANAIWQVRDKLPVIESEIGDTWIHGLATDPYKTAALKELIVLKNEANLDKGSKEYEEFMDNLLCVAEHTWGGDSKIFLSDYSHYDKKAFTFARANDDTCQSTDIEATEYGQDIIEKRRTGEYNQGSYKAIELAWQEQRDYIKKAIYCLSPELQQKAKNRLQRLIPCVHKELLDNGTKEIANGDLRLSINSKGNVEIYHKGDRIFAGEDSPITYMPFTADDYDVWLGSYTRDFDDNHIWSLPDFARPFMHLADGMYPTEPHYPKATRAYCDGKSILVEYEADRQYTHELGCPRLFQVKYTIKDNKIKVSTSWFSKDASRIPEATFMRFYPTDVKSLMVKKCGYPVDISDIVENGSRRLYATEETTFDTKGRRVKIINHHSPLTIAGFCYLVRFNNNYPKASRDGIAYVLHDSIWGTNFPLWYESNARFDYTIEIYE